MEKTCFEVFNRKEFGPSTHMSLLDAPLRLALYSRKYIEPCFRFCDRVYIHFFIAHLSIEAINENSSSGVQRRTPVAWFRVHKADSRSLMKTIDQGNSINLQLKTVWSIRYRSEIDHFASSTFWSPRLFFFFFEPYVVRILRRNQISRNTFSLSRIHDAHRW